MIRNKPQLHSFAITKTGLTAVADVPASVLQLANDLYRYIVEEHPPRKAKSKAVASAKASTTMHVIFDTSLPLQLGGHSWHEIHRLSVKTVASQTSKLLDRWLLERPSVDRWLLETPSVEQPASLSAAYGLIRLDQAWDGEESCSDRLNAACVAGHCLGLAAFASGMVKGVSRGGRKAGKKRWARRDEIREMVRERYRTGAWPKKSEFIDSIADEVLARAHEERPGIKKLGITTNSVGPLIRKWIRDLKCSPHR